MGYWHQDERVSGEFSECGKFRFWLKVEFDPIIPAREKGTLAIAGLNPSKADLTRDDQIRPCERDAIGRSGKGTTRFSC